MSNTSTNKTANKPTKSNKDKDKLRVIVGEIGRDTKTGILGRGYSNDNGKTFHVTDTMYGRLYDPNDIDGIWNGGTADRVKKEVDSATAEIPAAVSAANSAVQYAESAVAASKVNSDAIVAQSEAISEAKSAMDSATAEIQQTAANAASDAAKIRADVAQVQSEVDTAKAANSASVEALKSDVSAAKQDLADVHDSLTKAQSAIEQNQKLINDSVAKITSDVSATKQDLATVHDSLTKAQAAAEQNQKAINDSIAQINANVDATNQDLAGVRKDLTKAQSDITANQKAIDDNVAQISDDITQDRKDIADVRQGLTKAQADITANQKSINDNVAQINADITQDRKDIASAQQANADTAKQLDTYSKQAQEQNKTIKAVQDKQDGFTATLADVQGNVSQVSDKVDGLSANLKDAQDNVASVKAQADQLSATLTDHAKSIATLTASAKELSSTLEDADGRLSKVEQTAQANSSTLSDVQGDLSQVKQNATTLTSTLKDAQGNISTLQQKADSVSAQLASAQGDIATLQTGVDGVKATLTSHDKSIHTLQADSKSLKDSMADAQGDISTLSKTATDVTSELEDHTGRLSKVEQTASKQATTLSDLQGNLSQVEQKADSNTATISSINKNAMQDRGAITDTKTSFDSLIQLGTYSIKASGLPKMPEQHYGTLVVSGSAGSGWISQQFVADTTGNVYTRVFSNNAWSAWKQGGSQDAINQVKQTADSNSATIRNVQGDVSTLKQTATGIKSTLASHEGDIHTLQADSKSLKDSMTNAQGDISTLQKSATSLDSEMKDHAGRLSKVEQNAATQATTLSDLQGNLTQVKQQADGLVTTLKDAQGSITQIQQKADGTLAQLKSAQGDIASLQTDVTSIKATIADHDKNIHTLQADSKSLTDDMADAQGNISKLQKTSTDLMSEMQYQDGRLSKVEQTAGTLTSAFADQQGHLNQVEQTAQGTQQTVANQQGQINNIKTDAAGMHQTITGQGNQIANINVTLNGLNTKYEGVSGDLNNLKSQAQWVTVNGAVDLNNIKTPCHEFLKGTVTNAPNETAWWYLTVEGSEDNRITQTVIADQSANRYTRQWADSWSAWVRDATQTDVTTLSNRITTNSTQIAQNKQAIALKADQSTVNNLSGEVSQNTAQLKVQADQISSKVSSEDFNTLSNKVNGMKIGGRNLLHGTSDKWIKFTNSGWGCFTTAKFSEVSTSEYHTGDTFTYSATICNNGKHDVALQLRPLDSNKKSLSYYQSASVKPGQQNMRVSCTASVDANTYYMGVWVYFPNNDGSNDIVLVKEEQLEEGNVRTPWTPNPDDTIASIQKNTTAIDQTNKQISLKADQTEVDQIKNTATQNSSHLNVMADEISSKVTSTDVNNIVNSKGYATTNSVQSMITQSAGSINETITNFEGEFNSSSSVNLAEKTNQGTTNWGISPGDGASTISEININGVRGVRFTQTRKSTSWWFITYPLNLDYFEPNQDYIISFDMRTSSDNFNQGGMLNIARGDSSHPYLANIGFKTNFKQNQLTHVSCTGHSYNSLDKNGETFYLNCLGLGQCDWVDIVNLKIARGAIDKGYSPAPSDNATVTQVQSLTASIDGLQSTVANKADKSQITQLSNVIQSKVSSSDFNALKDETTWKSTDSIDLNTAVSQQKIFVKGGSNLPPGGYWWYVQVEPGYDSRIVQYAVSDRDNLHYSRQYDGSKWSAWSQGATESEITQLRDDINLRVKSGDLLSQINIQAGRTLIQSQKIYMDADSVIMGPNTRAFIPSAAIINLDVAKLNAGTINTDRIHIGDDSVYLSVKNNYLRLDGSNTKDKYQLRLTGNDIEFADNDSSNWEYRIQHGITKYQTDEDGLDFDVYSKRGGANHTVMAVSDAGVMISPSLFFQTDGIDSSNWMGFTRNTVDGNSSLSFHTWDDNNEGFHVDCGARFMNYVYINGYARAQGWLTNSTLSKKTNIRKLDLQTALDKIRQDDQYLYEYKRNVAKGIYDPQASFIIDDIHDVAQYSVPREFIDQSGEYREPNVELAYLVAAFQALDKQVQSQQAEIKKLKEQLNND